MNFDTLFNSFATIKIAVIGDVMIDTYWWGKVDRISPEAPVPIVSVQKKEVRLGGAANVALNLCALQANVTALTVIGNDDQGKNLLKLMQQQNINTNYVVQDATRPTTNKTRIISRNQQMLRLDDETTLNITASTELLFFDKIKEYINNEKPKIIIFEDYNKGVVTKNIINWVVALCNSNNIITAVDPKQKNFFEYKNVTIFKPNISEVKEGLHIAFETIDQPLLAQIHNQLFEQLHHKISLITLSEKGVYYNNGQISQQIPTHIRNIADVSGAGDTVIATAALVFAATNGNILLASEVANIAGGLVCENVGTAPIDAQKLLAECKRLLEG
jgi:D-glycero-beta-D-manno-heptose-7-phosphate kinase